MLLLKHQLILKLQAIGHNCQDDRALRQNRYQYWSFVFVFIFVFVLRQQKVAESPISQVQCDH